jgi:hypothetical protein
MNFGLIKSDSILEDQKPTQIAKVIAKNVVAFQGLTLDQKHQTLI